MSKLKLIRKALDTLAETKKKPSTAKAKELMEKRRLREEAIRKKQTEKVPPKKPPVNKTPSKKFPGREGKGNQKILKPNRPSMNKPKDSNEWWKRWLNKKNNW